MCSSRRERRWATCGWRSRASTAARSRASVRAMDRSMNSSRNVRATIIAIVLATTVADGQVSKRVNTNAVDADGTTALHWAVRGNDVQKVRALLGTGANANAANNYGMTPLILAATN